MRVGSFSVLIPEGREHGSGHVGIVHGSVYTLRLGNHGYARCDAQVTIDGKDLGTYRLNATESWTLERSAHDSGRFTFLRADSSQAAAADVHEITTTERGLIQVTFRPERAYQRHPRGGPCGQSRGMSLHSSSGASGPTGFSAGITGLTGHSDQQFQTVANLNHDLTGEVVITLRLVEDALCETVRKLQPAPRGNPVPKPV